MNRIAFVGYKVQEKYNIGLENDEDSVVLNFLKNKGLNINFVIWNDTTINWADYSVILLKSPWDYHENIDKFYQWLDKVNSLKINVLNPIEIIKWNSDKHYLDEIYKSGLNVISSKFLDKNTEIANDFSIFEELKSDKIVFKPCISAGAKNTFIIEKSNFMNELTKINQFIKEEDYIIQPFVEEINNGEWSFLFFNGKYSHCVLKLPKKGDFRVQHFYGAKYEYPKPNPKHITQASEFVEKYAKATAYARVDGVLINDNLHLMELELIEPFLFINKEKIRLENYYQGILELI